MRHKGTKPLTRMNVNVLLLIDDNAAVAHAALAQFDLATGEMVADEETGSAKREPGDPRNDKIASNMAVGRALVNLGLRLQDTGRIQVGLAMAEQDFKRQVSVARRLLEGVQPVTQASLLPVDLIRERYGDEAAARATQRREPHGKHARPGRKG